MAKYFLRGALITCLLAASVLAAQTSGPGDEQGARQLAQLLNQERAKAGLPPLQWDERLAGAALDHSRLMAEDNVLTHQFAGEPNLQLRLAKTSLRQDRAGENVAYDQTVSHAHDGLMHSPPHRANILEPGFNAVGVGVAHRGSMIYVTEDFADCLPELSNDQFEKMTASAVAALRNSSGAPPLALVPNSRLRNMACQMGKNDSLSTNEARFLPQARFFVAYTAREPEKLPSGVTELRKEGLTDRYSVGACFARSITYPEGVFWVLMVFYAAGAPARR